MSAASRRTGTTVHRATDGTRYTIRIAELPSSVPIATLGRAVRLADGVIAVLDATVDRAPRVEAVLRVADDHQIARMVLVTGLDHPAADFERCLRAVAGRPAARAAQ